MEKRVQIITALIALLIASYFVAVIWFYTSEKETLKTTAEWMLLIPMMLVAIGMIAAIAYMVAISRRKETNPMKDYAMEKRRRERPAPITRITIHNEKPFTLEGMSRFMENILHYCSFNYLMHRNMPTQSMVMIIT